MFIAANCCQEKKIIVKFRRLRLEIVEKVKIIMDFFRFVSKSVKTCNNSTLGQVSSKERHCMLVYEEVERRLFEPKDLLKKIAA